MSREITSNTSEIPPIVLLIDGDRENLETYSRCFEDAGLWVATTTLAEEAVASAEELHPDVIVADEGEFAAGSFEAVETLKRHPSLGEIPVVLLRASGATSPSVADVILTKPVPAEFLLRRTREVLARSRELRSRSNDIVSRGHALTERSQRLLGAAEPGAHKGDTVPHACPVCTSPLDWVERGKIGGVTYDYFRWCLKGCGLFCYDNDAGKWIKLA